jgi:hypothetical protein
MRHLALAILGVLLVACGEDGPVVSAGLIIQNDAPDDPSRPFFFDFGRVEHGTRQELPIYFLNTETEPIIVREIDPACACTSAKRLTLVDEAGQVLREGNLERRGDMLTVPPGGRVELLLGVDTRSVLPNREKLAIMRITTDSLNTPWITLEIHLLTHRPFLVTPASIQLGAVPFAHGGAAQCRIMTGTKDGDSTVVGVRSTSGEVEATLDYVFVNDEHVWTLTARVPPLQPMGAMRDKIVLDTIDSKGVEGTLAVDVWASVVEDVGFTRVNPHFGVIRVGRSATLTLELVARVPGMRVRLLDVQLSGPAAEHITATWGPTPGAYVDDEGKSETWAVSLEAGVGLAEGRFEAQLRALLSDDQYPVVSTKVQGLVR